MEAMTSYVAALKRTTLNRSSSEAAPQCFSVDLSIGKPMFVTKYFRPCQSSPLISAQPVSTARLQHYANLETFPSTRTGLTLALTFHISFSICLFLFLSANFSSSSSLSAWLIVGISRGEFLSPGVCMDTHHPVTSNPKNVCLFMSVCFSERGGPGGHINKTRPCMARLRAIWKFAREIFLYGNKLVEEIYEVMCKILLLI